MIIFIMDETTILKKESPDLHDKNRFWKVTGKILLSLAIALVGTSVVQLIAILLLVVSKAVPSEDIAYLMTMNIPWVTFILVTLQGICFIGAAAMMYAWFERKRGWPTGLKQPRITMDTLVGLGWGAALISAAFLIMWIAGGIEIRAVVWNDPKVWSAIGWSLAMFTAVAVSEEIFSRGYIQGLISYHYGSIAAVIVSSVVFALLHSFNPAVWSSGLPILNLILAGVLLGVCRLASGGLWLPIGVHLTWNFFQGNVFGFKVSGTEVESVISITPSPSSILSGGDFGAEGSVVVSILLIIATYLTYWWFNLKRPPAANVIGNRS
ncbi:CPBP family glutamic-type intramembrane protease [Paenibacillus tarimensis]